MFIFLTQFQTLTGLSRPSVSEAILKLVSKKVLVPKKVLYINIYSFNKDYSEWTSTQKGTSRVFPTRVVPKKVLKLVPKKVHTKDNKDIYTKDNTIVDVTTVTNNLNHLINLFKGVNPNYELLFSNKTERRALQRQVDKFSYKRIENLLNQLPEIVARPYSPRITRPSELEKKMGQLIIFLNQGKNDRRKVVDARGI